MGGIASNPAFLYTNPVGLTWAAAEAVAKPLMKSMKAPSPPQPGAAPSTESPAIQDVAATTSKSRAKARGYASTILSQQLMPVNAAALRNTYGS